MHDGFFPFVLFVSICVIRGYNSLNQFKIQSTKRKSRAYQNVRYSFFFSTPIFGVLHGSKAMRHLCPIVIHITNTNRYLYPYFSIEETILASSIFALPSKNRRFPPPLEFLL
jgi:hypothetical protein